MSSRRTDSPSRLHDHAFGEGNPMAERNTRRAVALTAMMMVVEIGAGHAFNSMALLADGWHMSSHALALGLAALAYGVARRLAHDTRFNFGTWKIEVLGGYTSACLLIAVAVWMLWQSLGRLIEPVPIHHDQALIVAALGLLVNLVCAYWLKDGHHGHASGHGHEHGHGHGHSGGEDLNLRAAYLHVVADAATSVLAIAALFGGKLWGADWLDPMMGVAGAVLVALWAWGLLRSTARVLLDAEMDAPVVAEIREAVTAGPAPAEVVDLHVWRVAAGKYACIVSLLTSGDETPDDYRKRIQVHDEIVHVSVEVNRIGPPAIAA